MPSSRIGVKGTGPRGVAVNIAGVASRQESSMSEAPPTARPPVMHDVARLAGVSHQTVSRVINGSPRIRPETRQRVERAIEQLGYRPNTAARALVRGRSGVIGVGGGYFGPASIQRSIESAARASGLFASTVSLATLTRALLDDSVEHL